MANSGVIYREFRCVIKDDFTECYVLMDATGDSPLGVQGWHYKVFPKDVSVKDILDSAFLGDDDCILWPQKAPDAYREAAA